MNAECYDSSGSVDLDSFMAVEGLVQSPLATTQLVRFNFADAIDYVWVDPSAHWLDLCLTPRLRNARACYTDHWHQQRFEPLGDVYMVPAGQALHARGDVGGHTAIICLLQSGPDRGWLDTCAPWTDRRLEASLNIRSSNIRNLLVRLGEEARHPGFASEALAEAIAEQLVIELARYYYASPTDGPITTGLAPSRLRLIDERLMDLPQAATLTELAELCNLSVRQLTRAFRESRGCTIGEYIAQRRMEKAKRLLEGDESVKAIAYSMGFGSPASFCYAFRRATGEAPGEYRRRIRAAT